MWKENATKSRNSLKENVEIISEKNELNFWKSKKSLYATEAEKPFLTAAHHFFLNVLKTVTEHIYLKLPFYHQICCFEYEDNSLTQHFPF